MAIFGSGMTLYTNNDNESSWQGLVGYIDTCNKDKLVLFSKG